MTSANTGSGSKLPQLGDVKELSGSVVRVLGGNSNKFTLQGTNTYLLGTSHTSLMIVDTAQGYPQWISNLKARLSSLPSSPPPKIQTCLLTHWHHDHILGLPDLVSLFPDIQIYKGFGKSIDPDGKLKDFNIKEIKNGDVFSDGEGFEVQAMGTPGHTKDHMCFVIKKSRFEEEVGSIFTGDNVLGHGTAVFEDLAVYTDTLTKMKERCQTEASAKSKQNPKATNPLRAYPGHGEAIEDAAAKIEEYINHRKMREEEVMNVLRYGSNKKPAAEEADQSGKEWDSMEIVKVVYKDVPVHLHEPARGGVVKVLEKLKGEGRVSKGANGKWTASEKGLL